jgi:hypothetical protein
MTPVAAVEDPIRGWNCYLAETLTDSGISPENSVQKLFLDRRLVIVPVDSRFHGSPNTIWSLLRSPKRTKPS